MNLKTSLVLCAVLAGCGDPAANDPTLWLSLDDSSPTPEREVKLVPYEPPPF
ncbi:MAG: hypothetical protein ACTHU0_33455 [Kofleriaceae bacterium]